MRRLQAIYALISERKAFTCPPESIDWRECGPHPQDPNTLLWGGYFTSPHNDIMPAGVETCHFMMLTPAEATEWRPGAVGVALSLLNSARDIVVLLPATNEETYDDRMSHGLSLVQERGAVVLAVMAPFYGPRQPLRSRDESAVCTLLARHCPGLCPRDCGRKFLQQTSPSSLRAVS